MTLEGTPKFCPYCGSAISKGKGLLSDDDCPATDHTDAVILKPGDFKEKSGIKDDVGLTFAEKELLNERNNSEYKEYEQRDDRFDYFANDTRYNDFSRFNFDQSAYAPTERAVSYDEREKAEQKELEELNKSRAEKSAEIIREAFKKSSNTNETPKEKKIKIKRTDTTASWEKNRRTKTRSVTAKKLSIFFIFLVVLCFFIPAIFEVIESIDRTWSSVSSVYDPDEIYLDYELSKIAYAFYDYDYKSLMELSFEGKDMSNEAVEEKIKLSKLSGGEKALCKEEFNKLQTVGGTDFDGDWSDITLQYVKATDFGTFEGYDAVTAKCKLGFTSDGKTKTKDFYINFVDCDGYWYYITEEIEK